MKKSLLNLFLVILGVGYLTACGNNGNNNNPAVNTASSCPAGQVLTQGYGCAQQCPSNPQMASYGGGYCNVPAIQSNGAQCPTAGQVPTMYGCAQQCPSNPQMASYGGGYCNVQVSYSNSSSYGYGTNGYTNGYNYNYGYTNGNYNTNPYGGYNPWQGNFNGYSPNYYGGYILF